MTSRCPRLHFPYYVHVLQGVGAFIVRPSFFFRASAGLCPWPQTACQSFARYPRERLHLPRLAAAAPRASHESSPCEIPSVRRGGGRGAPAGESAAAAVGASAHPPLE